MAVEDGAILGSLLTQLNDFLSGQRLEAAERSVHINEVLKLYESAQRERTTTNVKGAINNRHFYHMPEGPEQMERDDILANHTWTNETSKYLWCDMLYNRQMLDFDVLENARKAFKKWRVD